MRLQPLLRIAFALLLPASVAPAQVTLPHALGSHMVLQRDAPIHIWGWAAPGQPIDVSLAAEQAHAVTDTLGRFDVWLAPLPAGGPYDLRIHGGSQPDITLTDILLGDLWLASGQSNMEMPLAGFANSAELKDSAAEIAAASHPTIRLLLVKQHAADHPQADIDGTWQICTPDTARSFSAVAYFFGRELAGRENVPIGLIDSTWGGTPAEAWTSMDALAADPALAPVFQSWAHFSAAQQSLTATITAEKAEDAAARAAGAAPPHHPWHPNPASWQPAALYNGMIAPLTPLTIRGVIWYQGETNSALDRAPVYHRLFTTFIGDWRARFQQGNFPFLYVQISSFTSTAEEAWGPLRDAQRRTLATANTAMAVSLDVGNPTNVHPADKQTVGHRLALAARALSYGERIEFAGPEPYIASPENGQLRLWFRSAGLKCAGTCRGFEVAGLDHRFHPAQAHIDTRGTAEPGSRTATHTSENREGNYDTASVVLSSTAVPHPLFARYAWSNATDANLTSDSGLPTSTFTTEDSIAAYSLTPTAVSPLTPPGQ